MDLQFEIDDLTLVRGINLYPNLRFGDLILVRNTSLVDRIIGWVTKCNYNHVAVYVGGGLVIEVQGFRRVGYQYLPRYEGKYDVYRYKDTPTNGQQTLILSALQSRIGTYRDCRGLIRLFFRYILKCKLPWREMHRSLSSGLVRDAFESARLRMPTGEVYPEDLIEWFLFKRVL